MIYDLKIGRFLSPDPLIEMFPEQTPCHYAFNSPLIWKDPSGLKSEKEQGDKILEQEVITIQEGYLIVQYIYDVTDDARDANFNN